MKLIKNIVIVIFVLFFIILLFLDEEIENIGEQTYTLMVYMCGSDLETDGGYATTDISEMLMATKDEKVNIVMQTGCTNEWQNYGISNEELERYVIEDGELNLVDSTNQNMLETNTLTDFINFAKTNYEADRYGLIMWDHGGGAISGFGYDETIESDDTMSIDEIKQALNNTDVKFDFVGFDACLMATVETAYMLKGKADYLIASEELEPGTGWNYTEIINGLSSNTDIETLDLGKIITDSFIESNVGFLFDEEATLSVVNVNEIDSLITNLTEYMKQIDITLLQTSQFNKVAKAIDKTKAFGYGEVDTIDLYHLVQNLETNINDTLITNLEDVVEYNNTTSVMENSNGLSIYIPYIDLDNYSKMIDIYNNIGMPSEYISVLSKIANTVAGGQTKSNYQTEQWYDSSYIEDNQQYYDEYEYETLEIVDQGDYYALLLDEEDWEVINTITAEVLYDDGEGYVDLGSDDYYETTDEGNLIVSFDGTWISLDGNIVPFYVTESTASYTKAIVPAYLNDELVELIVLWDSKNPDGIVKGARPATNYGDTTIETRRLIELKQGDKIEFIFDYYTYDLEYENSYTIGDALILEDKDIVVEYKEVEASEFYVYYKITDIYNNEYYTEAVILY